jgi:hypothetical protein
MYAPTHSLFTALSASLVFLVTKSEPQDKSIATKAKDTTINKIVAIIGLIAFFIKISKFII